MVRRIPKEETGSPVAGMAVLSSHAPLHPCDTARGRHGSSRDFFGSGSPHPRRLTIRDKFVELPRIVRADVAAPLRTRRTHQVLGREARTAALVRKLPRVRGWLWCLLRPAVLGHRPFRPVRSVRSRCRPASGCLQRAVPGRHVRVGSRGFAVCVGRRPPSTQDCTTWRSSLQPPAGLAVETTPIPPQVAAAIPHCHLPLRLFELQQLEALQKHKVGLSLHRRVHIGARHQLARRAIASECVGAHQRRARHSHASDPRDPRLRNQLCSEKGKQAAVRAYVCEGPRLWSVHNGSLRGSSTDFFIDRGPLSTLGTHTFGGCVPSMTCPSLQDFVLCATQEGMTFLASHFLFSRARREPRVPARCSRRARCRFREHPYHTLGSLAIARSFHTADHQTAGDSSLSERRSKRGLYEGLDQPSPCESPGASVTFC